MRCKTGKSKDDVANVGPLNQIRLMKKRRTLFFFLVTIYETVVPSNKWLYNWEERNCKRDNER